MNLARKQPERNNKAGAEVDLSENNEILWQQHQQQTYLEAQQTLRPSSKWLTIFCDGPDQDFVIILPLTKLVIAQYLLNVPFNLHPLDLC